SSVESPVQAGVPSPAPEAPQTSAKDDDNPSDPSESETMDQLMDHFSAPQAVAAEGEIFDGRVLAVTDAGVVVDVGGKFEGLVPAQEFLDSGSPIEFGEGRRLKWSGCTSRR